MERQYLRHRKLHTKAFVHISDDKTHDSYAAQTFMNKTFDYLKQNYVDTGKEAFFAWHMHSDNAASHFKSSKTMFYVTTLREKLKSWASGQTFRVFWEVRAISCALRLSALTPIMPPLQFGAPGHGKGVWDGIGAWIKRTVRRDIIDNNPPDRKTVKVKESDHILTPVQVAEHVKASFNTEEYVQSHVNKTINEVRTLPADLTLNSNHLA